jgi:hypothetical protein
MQALNTGPAIQVVGQFRSDGSPAIPVREEVSLRFTLPQFDLAVSTCLGLDGIANNPVAVWTQGPGMNSQELQLASRWPLQSETVQPSPAGLQVLSGRPKPGIAPSDFRVDGAGAVSGYDPTSNVITYSGAGITSFRVTYPAAATRQAGVLGGIEVRVSGDLMKAAGQGQPVAHTITLPAKSAYWCYYFPTDLAPSRGDWKIVPANGTNGVSFSDAGRSELSGAVADDAFGAALVAQFPGRRVLRFLSDAPVPSLAAPVKGLQLKVGDAVLFASLPNPRPATSGMIKGQFAFSRTIPVNASR